MHQNEYDALVIGSGFGGSVVACRLAEAGMRVCVLERGRAFPPGSFPRTQRGLSRNVWDPSRGTHGMFNVWSFSGIEALVAAGLGGGSLIYANVLLRKPAAWFAEDHDGRRPWPVSRDDLDPHYDRVEARMNVQRYPFEHRPYSGTRKTAALKEAAGRLGLDWERPPLAVTFGEAVGEDFEPVSPVPGVPIPERRPNLHAVLEGRPHARTTCRLCGECDVGCNYGSKNTLDFTYLTDAHYAGAEIRTLCEAQEIEPVEGGGYRVHFARHDPDGPYWKTAGRELESVTADRLVLSAGTLGSTFLLLKNRKRLGPISPRLGERFCGNGDLLSFAMKCGDGEGADRQPRDLGPTYGPVITSTVSVPDRLDGAGDGRGFYIQDAGFPAFVTWILEAASFGTLKRAARAGARFVRRRLRRDPDADIGSEITDLLGACALSEGSVPLLGMGRDIPDGRFTLTRGPRGEPHLACDWTMETSRPFFGRVRDAMEAITRAWGGTFVPNPTFRMSRVVTVHPLGGCSMGRGADDGVVNEHGEVFGNPGLYVADGAVMPGPVGPNPALTIAALADRTADYILRKPDARPFNP